MSEDYMDKVGVFLESFPEIPELPEDEFNAWLLEQLLSRKQELFEITDALEKIPMFIDSKTRYDAFLEGVRDARNSSADRAVLSMMHFLNKIVTAPTTAHARGAVILTLPAVSLFIRERELDQGIIQSGHQMDLRR